MERPLTVGVHLLSFFSVSSFGDRFPFEWVPIVNSLAKYEPRVVVSILFSLAFCDEESREAKIFSLDFDSNLFLFPSLVVV